MKKTKIWTGIILAIAIFWRLVNFPTRWVLNQDQARDATIALYGLRTNQIPPLGSPSSAGPFNFGPWYDWIIMIFTKLSLGIVEGPWLWFAILSATTVWAYILLGRKLWGRRGMVITGLLAAGAVGQVENAPDMLNTVLVGWSSGWAMYFLVKMVEDRKIYFGIPLGFLVGLSINFHFQSWGLMTLLGMAFLINHFKIKKKILAGVMMGMGWIGAFLPLIIFDIQRKGAWVNSVIWYYTEGVKKFYVPVRWLTEIRDFWPRLFGSVIVGVPEVGYIIILIIIVGLFLVWKNKIKVSKTWLVVLLSLLAQVILMRFYKGVRSREYLIVFHGYIIFLTSWAIGQLFNFKKILGLMALIVIGGMAGWQNWKVIKIKSQAQDVLTINKELGPGKMEIYQTKGGEMISLPIFYLRYHDNLTKDGERKLLICDEAKFKCPNTGKLVSSGRTYRIYENEEMSGYEKLSPELIYSWLWVNYGK